MHHSARKKTHTWQKQHRSELSNWINKFNRSQLSKLRQKQQQRTSFIWNNVFSCTEYTFLCSFLNIHQIIFIFQIDISLLVDFDDHNKKHHSIPFKILFSFIFYLYYFMTTTYLPKSKRPLPSVWENQNKTCECVSKPTHTHIHLYSLPRWKLYSYTQLRIPSMIHKSIECRRRKWNEEE